MSGPNYPDPIPTSVQSSPWPQASHGGWSYLMFICSSSFFFYVLFILLPTCRHCYTTGLSYWDQYGLCFVYVYTWNIFFFWTKTGVNMREKWWEGEHWGEIRVRRSGARIIIGHRCVYIMRQCFCAISTLWQTISPTKSPSLTVLTRDWLTPPLGPLRWEIWVQHNSSAPELCVCVCSLCADLKIGRKDYRATLRSSWLPHWQVFYHSEPEASYTAALWREAVKQVSHCLPFSLAQCKNKAIRFMFLSWG